MDSSREERNERENDRAHAELSKRVDDLSGEFDIVRRLPQAVGDVAASVEALERDAERLQRAVEIADAREERRVRDLRAYVDRRLAERPAAPKVPWTTIVAFAGTVIVPVVIAILGWYFVKQGGA